MNKLHKCCFLRGFHILVLLVTSLAVPAHAQDLDWRGYDVALEGDRTVVTVGYLHSRSGYTYTWSPVTSNGHFFEASATQTPPDGISTSVFTWYTHDYDLGVLPADQVCIFRQSRDGELTYEFAFQSGELLADPNDEGLPSNDGDEMPDAWEAAVGLNPWIDDGEFDADFDMVSNFLEYQHGLNPTNPETTPGTSDYSVVHGASAGNREYFYDQEDRLVGVRHSEGFSLGYRYDGNGNILNKRTLLPDANGDGVSDLHAYLVGLDPSHVVNPLADSDGDGWSDGQEIMSLSDPQDGNAIPGLVGEAGTGLYSADWPFVPDRLVLEAANLDALGGDELLLSADGDPGSQENQLVVINEVNGSWLVDTIPLGLVGVTSMAYGKIGDEDAAIYLGLRDAILGGGILQVRGHRGTGYTTNLILRCEGEAAYVEGLRDGLELLISHPETSGGANRLYALRQGDGAWTETLRNEAAGNRSLSELVDLPLGGPIQHGSLARLMDAGGIQLLSSHDNPISEDSLEIEYRFEGNTFDALPAELTPMVLFETLHPVIVATP